MTTTGAQSRRPLVIGVTGNIACGKSLVLESLEQLGAKTIDADAVYHGLIESDSPLWRALVAHFGDGILDDDRRIDRRSLGAIVFADPPALAELDRLTHPAVVDEIERLISESTDRAIAVDAVKLIESGLDRSCDRVWLVICHTGQQIERLMARNKLSRAEAERRVAGQPPLGPKIERADLVVDNSGTKEETRQQVKRAWAALPFVSSY